MNVGALSGMSALSAFSGAPRSQNASAKQSKVNLQIPLVGSMNAPGESDAGDYQYANPLKGQSSVGMSPILKAINKRGPSQKGNSAQRPRDDQLQNLGGGAAGLGQPSLLCVAADNNCTNIRSINSGLITSSSKGQGRNLAGTPGLSAGQKRPANPEPNADANVERAQMARQYQGNVGSPSKAIVIDASKIVMHVNNRGPLPGTSLPGGGDNTAEPEGGHATSLDPEKRTADTSKQQVEVVLKLQLELGNKF